MALADFTLEDSPGAEVVAVSLNGTSPISGTYSADATMSVGGIDFFGFYYTAGLNKNCVQVNALFQQRGPGASTSFSSLGVMAQLQLPFAWGGSGYFACLHNGTYGLAGKAVIVKDDIGTAINNATGVANADVTLPAENVTYAIGLRCEENPTTGHVLLTMLVDLGPISTPVNGLTYNFPGLVPVASYLDITSPYATGTFGVFGRAQTSHHDLFDVLVVDTD